MSRSHGQPVSDFKLESSTSQLFPPVVLYEASDRYPFVVSIYMFIKNISRAALSFDIAVL